jgi:recombination protein RecA
MTTSHLPTGSLSLDISLRGGWRRGGIIDIQGPETSGKTTLAQHACGGLGSNEDALWISLGTGIPLRTPNASIAEPRTAEEAFVLMVEAINVGASLVVVDSTEGLVRYQELIDPDYIPDPHREFKFELSQVRDAARKNNGIVMFLSRPRAKAPGLRGTGISEKAHQKVILKVVELKQSGRRRVTTAGGADFWIDPGTGIDWTQDLVQSAYEMDLMRKEGSWWYYGDEKFFGLDAAKRYFYETHVAAATLEAAILAEVQERFNW